MADQQKLSHAWKRAEQVEFVVLCAGLFIVAGVAIYLVVAMVVHAAKAVYG